MPGKMGCAILAAEDEENDLFLLKRAIKEAGPGNRLYAVTDGGEVINYLRGVGVYSERTLFPLPEILLLDLKMPRKNGFEILEWLKASDLFRKLPVIVLTSSHLRDDIDRAYSLGACGYFVKATDPELFIRQVRLIHDYWCAGAERPGIVSETQLLTKSSMVGGAPMKSSLTPSV